MLPEEVTRFFGKSLGTSVFQVEREAIRRFADAADDSNPLYYDEEYARKSKYGAIIAPPGMICAPWYWARPAPWAARGALPADMSEGPDLAKAGYGRLLAGGVEWEFFAPVKAGDTITAKSVIKDITEREGRTGKMVFVTTETIYTNQDRKVVAQTCATRIHLEGHLGT